MALRGRQVGKTINMINCECREAGGELRARVIKGKLEYGSTVEVFSLCSSCWSAFKSGLFELEKNLTVPYELAYRDTDENGAVIETTRQKKGIGKGGRVIDLIEVAP